MKDPKSDAWIVAKDDKGKDLPLTLTYEDDKGKSAGGRSVRRSIRPIRRKARRTRDNFSNPPAMS